MNSVDTLFCYAAEELCVESHTRRKEIFALNDNIRVQEVMLTLWTIGHSTRPLEDFLALLQENAIEAIADVRRFPASRRHPQFTAGALQKSLGQTLIDYLPFTELGGRRQPRPDSANTAWRNAAFRGYADYMETEEFRSAASRLINEARGKRTAIMCAEALWWQCHRALIADYLKASGATVMHILGEGETQEHPYTPAARIVDGRLSYADRGHGKQMT